jgi:uncharacterized glyoxalase superfamily protein PhnB
MGQVDTATPGTIIPTMRYRDARAAIAWLCEAFGFSQHLVVAGKTEGAIEHAQLTLGNGMIMVGSASDEEFGRMMALPEPDGRVTQSCYVVVEEIDAHYRRAKQAGARIVMEVADQDYGGRLYTARDPEGHLWSFGSYDPWASA